MPDLDLDAIEARANAALNSPTGQSYDAGVILSRDVPALVAALREARAGWYQNRDKADLCDAMIAERDEARAAIALAGEEIERASVEVARAHRALLASNAERNEAHAAIAAVRALCDHADSGLHAGLTMVSVAAVRGAILAALDVRHDPSATTDPQSASVSPEEALTVRCGTCDADPGEACVTVGPWPGRVQRYPHESRYGKAREARPSATTDGGAP